MALQLLGNLFEYFLVRKNHHIAGKERHHLTVIGATSGDTGSAAIYGLRNKLDVSVFILHPKGRVSPVQEAQMTTVLDANIHNLSVEGSFDDCQDIVKALFADPEMNKTHHVAAVNSINWARILAQIIYYVHSYFALVRSPDFTKGAKIRYVVPSGNFGDVLAGFYAQRMGLPIERLIIATNENDILNRFFTSEGHYTKLPIHGYAANGGIAEDGAKAHPDGVKETLSPAMDILVSSNFERLLWFLVYQVDKSDSIERKRQIAGSTIKAWLSELKSNGGFSVGKEVTKAAKIYFESERVSNEETITTIRDIYRTCDFLNTKDKKSSRCILDPHSAIGIEASVRSIRRNPDTYHISLATAHPAKFSNAVDLALRGEDDYDFGVVIPQEFVGLEDKEKRVTHVPVGAGWEGVREIVKTEVDQELR